MSWAEDQGPHLGAVVAEDDGAEVPAVILLNEILSRVGDLKAACSQALLLQEGLVQGKDDLKESGENIGPCMFPDPAVVTAVLFLLSVFDNSLSSVVLLFKQGTQMPGQHPQKRRTALPQPAPSRPHIGERLQRNRSHLEASHKSDQEVRRPKERACEMAEEARERLAGGAGTHR